MNVWLLTVGRLLLGSLLLFTGIVKFFDLRGFALIVAKYGVLPRRLVKTSAYLHPFIEAGVGLWLLSNYSLRWSSLTAAALMVASTVLVVAALLKKKRLENCGCYGTLVQVPLSWKKVVENLLWLAVALVLFWNTLS